MTEKEDPRMLKFTLALVNRLFPLEEASAHCDVPCGIYDPHYAQIAALTVVRMNQLIAAMEPPAMDPVSRNNYMHALVRFTTAKEEAAELVKHEVRIIRGDFFKPDNSPDNIGEVVEGIMKTASKARQNLDAEAADKLLDLVNDFAEAFWTAKGVKTKKQGTNQAAGGEFVVPAE